MIAVIASRRITERECNTRVTRFGRASASACTQSHVSRRWRWRTTMPFLNALFWAFFGCYIVHLLDETLLNGGFVPWIVENFWPQYRVRMFFWFNAAAIAAIIASNAVFDGLGGHWVILPIIWLAGFVTH